MPDAIDARSTALVLIDLQHSNLARTLAPHPAAAVLANCVALAGAWRAAGAIVVFVRVLSDEVLVHAVDRPFSRPYVIPVEAMQLTDELGVRPDDVVIAKRQWGAFYGTALEQVLRRRGIRTLVLGGIATNFGVESTARAAFDQGYDLVFAEDAMSSIDAEMHRFAVERLFPVIGRVRSTAQLLALASA